DARRHDGVLDLPSMIRAGKVRFDDYRAAHGTLRHALDRIAALEASRRHDRLVELGVLTLVMAALFLFVALWLLRSLVRRAIAPIVALSDAAQRGEVSTGAVRDSRLHEVIVLAETMEQLFRAVQARAMR